MRWQPFVTVAAVIEKENKFLLVEEKINGENLLNQPAGHWEKNETLIEAVIRETLEETAWYFQPEYLLGIYRWQLPNQQEQCYLRFAFTGKLLDKDTGRKLDPPIITTTWMTKNQLLAEQHRHRSPQVLRCVEDYLAGKRFPLDCLVNV